MPFDGAATDCVPIFDEPARPTEAAPSRQCDRLYKIFKPSLSALHNRPRQSPQRPPAVPGSLMQHDTTGWRARSRRGPMCVRGRRGARTRQAGSGPLRRRRRALLHATATRLNGNVERYSVSANSPAATGLPIVKLRARRAPWIRGGFGDRHWRAESRWPEHRGAGGRSPNGPDTEVREIGVPMTRTLTYGGSECRWPGRGREAIGDVNPTRHCTANQTKGLKQ